MMNRRNFIVECYKRAWGMRIAAGYFGPVTAAEKVWVESMAQAFMENGHIFYRLQ